MGLSQEELKNVYSRVKRIADNLDFTYASREQAVSLIHADVRREILGNATYVPRGGGYIVGNRGERKYKRYVKPKYKNIGLPSIEQRMLDKMIESVVDGLKLNEEGFSDLDNTVAKASACVSRAQGINKDCEKVMTEINKIPNFLETGKWDTEEH